MSAGAIGVPWWAASGVATAIGEAATAVATTAARANPLGVGLSLLFPTALNPGEDERMAQINRDLDEAQAKTKAQDRTRDVATTRTCNPAQDNKSCKDKDEHRGVIQAQEGSDMLVPGANWGPQPQPPSYTHCKKLLDKVYSDLKAYKGGGKEFQKGANTAYENLDAWMKKTTPSGWSAGKEPCSYFNDYLSLKGRVRDYRGKESRRIDFSVKKGRALTSF